MSEKEHARDVAEKEKSKHDHERVLKKSADACDRGIVHLRAVDLRVRKNDAHARGKEERDEEPRVVQRRKRRNERGVLSRREEEQQRGEGDDRAIVVEKTERSERRCAVTHVTHTLRGRQCGAGGSAIGAERT